MKTQPCIIAALFLTIAGLHAKQPLNILFFTADDMNFDSSRRLRRADQGPHAERGPLAAEGLRFDHAYSTVAVCQPVRQTMFTGLYPHRSGSMGFFPVKPEVRTLNQQLRDAGYLISRFGKANHLQPWEILHRCGR
jgi:N-sulfoglucosamine sulfohydrolase